MSDPTRQSVGIGLNADELDHLMEGLDSLIASIDISKPTSQQLQKVAELYVLWARLVQSSLQLQQKEFLSAANQTTATWEASTITQFPEVQVTSRFDNVTFVPSEKKPEPAGEKKKGKKWRKGGS